MSKVLLIIGWLWIYSTVFGAHAAASENTKPIAPKGNTIITATSKGMNIKIEIGTHRLIVNKEKLYENKIRCGSGQSSCGVVDYLRIIVNSKSIIVPRSVYCDLSDLTTAEVEIGSTGAVLILEGGDASESYIVKIEFNAHRVTKRLGYSGEIPDEPTQETVYYLPIMKDE